MDKCIRILEFAKQLFSDEKTAQQASQIMQGIMVARSPRLSDIASTMPGGAAASYKRIQRFLQEHDPHEALKMLFNQEAGFVIGDPTEIERPHADKTAYVGTLKDGETKGFWMLTLATPLRGRAIPFHFLTYSSRTIEDQPSSRNLEHFKAIQEIQQLIGTRPIVFDREFSYRELLNCLVEEGVHFVIRLNMGAHAPLFYYDSEQKHPLRLLVAPINKPQIYRQVYYMGSVCLNVIGIWRYGFKEPMWIMTNMVPEAALSLYDQRMKIEICFRDLKSLLHIDKVMNKSQRYLDKMLAMVMLAYAVCLIVGETIRDVQYAQMDPNDLNLLAAPAVEVSSRWYLFSGPFLLLKQRYRLGKCILRRIVAVALQIFAHLIFANVRTLVPT
jgi:Transposase DDE domain